MAKRSIKRATVAHVPERFDPVAYIADLRGAGLTVSPMRARVTDPDAGGPWDGRTYVIGRGAAGFGAGYGAVQIKWVDAMDADPDYVERVHDTLKAEEAAVEA